MDNLINSLEVDFPHTLCLHLIVITSDNKILRTFRSPKVEHYPETWSCSIEENFSLKDLEGNITLYNCCKRLLWEELAINDEKYDEKDFKILSVFLEAKVLNISLCGVIYLKINSQNLNKILKNQPRIDYEFSDWDFLDFKEDSLISELVYPMKFYHPTSGFRLLMVLIQRYGIPTAK